VLERGPGHLEVEAMRRGDDHAVEALRVEHLVGARVRVRDAEAFGRRAPSRLVRIGDGGDLGIRIGLQGRQVGPGRPPPAADDSDPCRYVSSRRPWRSSS
jgi:hypothetical protein